MSAKTETETKKLILIIGGTGAQGIAVTNALLASSEDGTPSPYAVRILTRNPDGRRAKELQAKGVELVVGEISIALFLVWFLPLHPTPLCVY